MTRPRNPATPDKFMLIGDWTKVARLIVVAEALATRVDP